MAVMSALGQPGVWSQFLAGRDHMPVLFPGQYHGVGSEVDHLGTGAYKGGWFLRLLLYLLCHDDGSVNSVLWGDAIGELAASGDVSQGECSLK